MHQGKLDCRVRFVPSTACLQLFPVEARWRAIRRAQFKGTPAPARASWFVVLVVVVPEVDYRRTVLFSRQAGLIMCKMHIHERLSLKQAERLADYGRLLSSSQPILNSRRRDLDRIQDLFPNDNLGLHLPEPSSTYSVKTKSFRKKSVGDLTALDNNNHHGHCNRIFLVEAPCVMSPRQLPLDAKPRHLFLFSDLLVVAKPRSGGTFKLKVS
ncbi:unnamed protein product, partial [Callosobruchus maculatus]